MSARSHVQGKIQDEVLLSCRRRCTVCFALTRDVTIKRGQIAHIDRDKTNNTTDNLVFLCQPHHDEYDTTSKQTKGLRHSEVKQYRAELHAAIMKEWAQPVTFAPHPAPRHPADRFAGKYIHQSSSGSAELQVTHLGGGFLQVQGFAEMSGTSSAATGSLDFTSELRDRSVYFTDRQDSHWYSVEIQLGAVDAVATEGPDSGYTGIAAPFSGQYKKVS